MFSERIREHKLWLIAAWIVFACLNATQAVVGMQAEGMRHDWMRLFAVYASSWTIWAIGTPVVLLAAGRYPIAKHWTTHLLLYCVLSACTAVWTATLDSYFEPMGFPRPHEFPKEALGLFYSRFHLYLLIYAGLLSLGSAIQSRQSLAERDAQLKQARLDGIMHTLRPHFLLNTLNGIAGLVRAKQDKTAVKMIAALGDLLRRSLDSDSAAMLSIEDEIQFAMQYLEIQKMRFGNRLEVEMRVSLGLERATVPSMILQPLIENAIKHGIADRQQGGTIRIVAEKTEVGFTICVQNCGHLTPSYREHVGIGTTRVRLNALCGEGARFDLREVGDGTVEARIEVIKHG